MKFRINRRFYCRISGKFWKNLWFLLAQINEISFFSRRSTNLLVKSWINPKFPVIRPTNFKTYTGEFLFAERRRRRIFLSNRYLNASYEWPILEQFMGKCCPSVSSLDRLIKLRHLLQWLPSNNIKINQNRQKISCKPSDFPKKLQFTCALSLVWSWVGFKKWSTLQTPCIKQHLLH